MHRHAVIEFEVHKLFTHEPVEQLIEVNFAHSIALVYLDTHFEENFLHCSISDRFILLWETNVWLQTLVEVYEFSLFQILTLLIDCCISPFTLELLKSFLIDLHRVLFGGIILVKLFNYDEYKKIQHNVCDKHDERHEVSPCPW